MEGYLKKYINFLEQWKDRYFILHEDCLHYCDTQGGQIKGTIHLKIATITQVNNDPLRIIINSGTNQIEVRAPTVSSKLDWLKKLKEAQEYAKSQFDSLNLEQLEQIVKSNKNLDPAYKKMLLSSNNQKIEKSLVEVYENGAKLDETISELLPQIQSNAQRQLLDHLQKYTHQIRKSLQECIQNLENERKRLYRSSQLLAGNINANGMTEMKYMNGGPSSSGSKNDQILNDYVSEDDAGRTEFESFVGDDMYFQKQSQQQIELVNNNHNNNNNNNNNDKIISIPHQNLLIPVSQQSLVSFFKDKCEVRYRLLTQNPVFQATEISDDQIRMKLPKDKDPNEKLNIWSILKDSIGKDLSKFAVPVYLNEPISMLQRLAEQMEYSYTLDKANAADDTCLALCHAMGFGASVYAATINRTKKPFNPLLGETFEYVDEKNGFRFISEQVSHHPPISAGIAESNNYIFQGDSNIKTQFWGKSFEVKPLGHFHIKLKRLNHDITFKKCTTAVKNIFIGQMFMDHYGVMEFKNHTTGDYGELHFREKSAWSDKGQYEIEGFVQNKNGQETYKLKGKWNDNLVCTNVSSGSTTEVWKRFPLPPNSEWNYHYTQFALQLNHLNKEAIKWVCPTDSRLRPDQRALEYGLFDLAADEKFRLEQKQRARRKENEAIGKQHEIAFFEQRIDPLTGDLEYKYKGGYWEAREKQDWSKFPVLDLY